MDERLEKALRSTKATLAIDGLYLRPEEEALIKENLEGKITDEEFRRRVLELINKPSK
jgi:hypothetical protein